MHTFHVQGAGQPHRLLFRTAILSIFHLGATGYCLPACFLFAWLVRLHGFEGCTLPCFAVQCTVTAVSMLPGGWLLAAGDAEGGLSCTDLRMIGGSNGEILAWHTCLKC